MDDRKERYQNLRRTMRDIERILIESHNERIKYTAQQIEVLSSLKKSFSERLASAKQDRVA